MDFDTPLYNDEESYTEVKPEYPEWYLKNKAPLTFEPWVVNSPYQPNLTSIFIGNSGLRIFKVGKYYPLSRESNWKQNFMPDGYDGKDLNNQFESDNPYMYSIIYAGAIYRFIDFWKNEWPDEIIKPTILSSITNRNMFNFRAKLLNDIAPESFTRNAGSKQNYHYDLNLELLEQGIETTKQTRPNHVFFKMVDRANKTYIQMENHFQTIVNFHYLI
jgi:hypothetical protein